MTTFAEDGIQKANENLGPAKLNEALKRRSQEQSGIESSSRTRQTTSATLMGFRSSVRMLPPVSEDSIQAILCHMSSMNPQPHSKRVKKHSVTRNTNPEPI